MATSYSATDARAALPEILDRVAAGEEVTISRHGVPVAVVVRPDALHVRRADSAFAAAQALLDSIAEPGDDAPPPGISRRAADAHVRALRAERSRT